MMSLKRRTLSRRTRPATRGPALDDVVFRVAGDDDARALERLAALDSRELAAGPHVVAEVRGDLVAATPVGHDTEPIADPFRRTAHLRELLVLLARRTAQRYPVGSAASPASCTSTM